MTNSASPKHATGIRASIVENHIIPRCIRVSSAWDGVGEPKLLENNNDTKPTSLYKRHSSSGCWIKDPAEHQSSCLRAACQFGTPAGKLIDRFQRASRRSAFQDLLAACTLPRTVGPWHRAIFTGLRREASVTATDFYIGALDWVGGFTGLRIRRWYLFSSIRGATCCSVFPGWKRTQACAGWKPAWKEHHLQQSARAAAVRDVPHNSSEPAGRLFQRKDAREMDKYVIKPAFSPQGR